MLPSFIARMSRPLTDEEKLAMAEKDRKYAELEAKQEDRRLRELLATYGLGVRDVDLVMGGELEPTEALAAVREWGLGQQTFLLLSGGVGTGKSLAAASAVLEALKAYQRARFVSVADLSRMCYGREAEERILAIQRTPLLVLDDLGREQLHDGWRPMFEGLIDHRWKNKLRTIITTNLPPNAGPNRQSIRGTYGERVADRIRHDCLIAKCVGESLRNAEAP